MSSEFSVGEIHCCEGCPHKDHAPVKSHLSLQTKAWMEPKLSAQGEFNSFSECAPPFPLKCVVSTKVPASRSVSGYPHCKRTHKGDEHSLSQCIQIFWILFSAHCQLSYTCSCFFCSGFVPLWVGNGRSFPWNGRSAQREVCTFLPICQSPHTSMWTPTITLYGIAH